MPPTLRIHPLIRRHTSGRSLECITTRPNRVTLLCENRTMRNVIDHFGEDVDTEIVGANHFRATVDVAPTPPFFAWVFTFGGAIRIEGPADVLAKMKDMAAWLRT